MKFRQIPIEQIKTAQNVRLEGEDGELGDLINSIGRVDVLQPILVIERGPSHFEVVSGHRRLAALKARNEPFAPCIIRDDLSEGDLVYIKLTENIQRKQLTAREVVFCVDELKKKNKTLTDVAIARKLGKSDSWLAYKRRIVRTQERLSADGMTAEVLRDMTDAELWKLSGCVVDPKVSEAYKEAFKDRRSRGPNGNHLVENTKYLTVYQAGEGKKLTVICREEGFQRAFLEYLKKFRVPRKAVKA